MAWYDYVHLSLLVAWMHVQSFAYRMLDLIELQPVFAIILALSLLSLLFSLFALLRAKRHEQRLREAALLRGSKMNKRARAKWLTKYAADRWVDMLEEAEDKGEISEGEKYHLYRRLARGLGLNDDLRKRSTDSGLVPPKKATSRFSNYPKDEGEKRAHLSIVKNGLISRLKWAVRRVRYKPVNIPGEKPPKIEKVRPKGFLRRKSPKFSTNAS